MAKSRKVLLFPGVAKLHVAANDLESAQQRWIHEHYDRLRALVQLSDHRGLEIVAREPEDDKSPASRL